MNLPEIATEDVWLAARVALLEQEKDLTRRRDALNTARRNLPMVPVTANYRFEGANGTVGLPELFEGRTQLIVYHFMFKPEWEKGCPSCTGWGDERSPGEAKHLHARDTTLVLVSRAPYPKLAAYAAERGWTLPWYSTVGADFNIDFGVTVDREQPDAQYNYRSVEAHQAAGTGYYFEGPERPAELPRLTCFLRDGDAVYRTYSTYGRGCEAVGGTSYFLDLTALGRREGWEEPKGRAVEGRLPVPDFT